MRLFHFEHRSARLAPPAVFLGRLARSVLFALALTGVALVIGIAGYMMTEHMSLLDAFLNAAMLLGGMGQVSIVESDAGKLFAGIYALFCGLFVVIASGVVLAPILHRILHAFHVEDANQN
jgi:hypothetical protein